MNNLSNYFKKFTQSLSPDRVLQKRCAEAIALYTGHTVDAKKISVQRGEIFLTMHPTRKHNVLEHRADILTYINNNTFGFRANSLR